MGPTLEEASARMTGTGADSRGALSLEIGNAFEVPWANRVAGVTTPDNEAVMSVWKGLTMILPSSHSGAPGTALGGLLLKRQADSVEKHVLADGWQSKAVYNASNFDGHWLSQTEVTTQVMLNSRVMELMVTAKNTGSVPEPMGIGWRGHFAIPSGDRTNAKLRLPNGMLMERRSSDSARGAGLPTGKLLPEEPDYTRQGGEKLGAKALNESLVHLKQGVVDIGPVIEIRDITGKVGLRITMLTPSIKMIRVESAADKATVAIDPQFNYDNPFGKEWSKEEDTGMVVLQPGQSTQWKIRMELFPLAIETGSRF